MTAPLTFSLDLEDHRADRSGPRRYPEMTRRVLDFLDEAGVRGTALLNSFMANRRLLTIG